MVVKLPMLMGGELKHREEDSKLKLNKKEVDESRFLEIFKGKTEKKDKDIRIESGKKSLKTENDKLKEQVHLNKGDEFRKISEKNVNNKSNIDVELKVKKKKISIKKHKVSKKDDLSILNNSIFFVQGNTKINKTSNEKVKIEKLVKKIGDTKSNFIKSKQILGNIVNLKKSDLSKINLKNIEVKKDIKNKKDIQTNLKKEVKNKDLKIKTDLKKLDIDNLKTKLSQKRTEKLVDLKKELKNFAIKENLNAVFKPPFSDNPQIKDLTLFISKELKSNFNLFQNQLFDIFNNIKVKNINGNYFVSMKLFPENLGKIDIYLKKVGKLVEGHIIVQSESIKSLIDGRIWEMKNLLSSGNLENNSNLANINVLVDNSNNGSKQFNKMFQGNDINSNKLELSNELENDNIENVVSGRFIGVDYLGKKINYYL